MNAALLVMSSALAAGADVGQVKQAGWGENALPGTVWGSCGCDTCGKPAKAGLLDTLKNKFGGKSSSCGCAPAPAPACGSCGSCGSTGHYTQPNLMDKLKSRWAAKKAPSCGCSSGCSTCAPASPCATGPVPAVVTPGNPPIEMPKPKDTTTPKDTTKPKDLGNTGRTEPRGGNTGPVSIPAVPGASEPVTLPPLPGATATPPAVKGGIGSN